MDPLRWQRIEGVFSEAMDRPVPARAAFVRGACAGDADLEREVLSLIDAAETDPSFLATPLVDLSAGTELGAPTEGEARWIDRYRLVRLLGRGGMGEVHLAVQEGDDFRRTVAVKLMRRGVESEDAALRFRQERRILARLRHPNIAALLDGGTTAEGVLYVVMEFVDGVRIDRFCDERELGVAERLRLVLDVCDAVQHAHRNLIIHRDLKPANILVTPEGDPKLLDFGIGKLLDADVILDADSDSGVASPLTETGLRLLTPEYAAPEQIRGEPVTTASDVFALGVVLYELLAGVHPWAGVQPHERLAAIEQGPPVRPSEAAEGAPATTGATFDPDRRRRRLAGDLDTILLKALRHEPDRRYPTVDALAGDLRLHLQGRPVSARPDTFGYRTSRFIRRNRSAVTATAVVLLTFLGAGTAMAIQRERVAVRVEAERDKLLETRDFLLEMFGAVGPEESGGRDVSARALLDAQAARVEDYEDRPEVMAEVQYVLADGYQRLGEVEKALPLAKAALAAREAVLPPGHPDVARARGLVGWIERERGENDVAEDHLRAAVEDWRSQEPVDPRGLSKALNDLGVVLGDQVRNDEAVSVLEEAVTLRRLPDNEGGDARSLGVTANNLAAAYWRQGRAEEAVALMEESVAALEASLGPEHGRVWLARANLMAFRAADAEPEERVAGWREHLAQVERLFGPIHRETARALESLGRSLYRALPGPDGAEARLTESRDVLASAIEVAEAAFGPDHPRTAYMLGAQANAQLLSRQYEAAIASRQRAIEIFRSVYGDDFPEIGAALREMARAYYGLGDGENGDRVAREALEQHRLALGPDHVTTLSQQVNVARRMTVTDQAADAVPLLRGAVVGIENLDPPRDRLLVQTKIALALALARSGSEGEAAEILEIVRPAMDTVPAPIVRAFEQAVAEAGPRGG